MDRTLFLQPGLHHADRQAGFYTRKRQRLPQLFEEQTGWKVNRKA